MEIINGIIRNIVIIIILASFLEMLLPSSNMKRYVKLVMGLFIMITILGPLLSLIDKKYSFELGNYQINNQAGLNDILNKGKAISEGYNNQAKEEYQKVLAKQIQGIAQLNNNLKVTNVRIKLRNQESEGLLTTGIEEVTLVIKKESVKQKKSLVPAKPNQNNSSYIKESIVKTVLPVKIQIGQSNQNSLEGGRSSEGLSPSTKEKIISTLASIYNLSAEQIKIQEE